MNYAYDLLINMNEDKLYNFYEWESYDPIEIIKKIPLYRVSTKTLKDFYLYSIKLSQEFLNSLLDKTIIKNNKLNKTLKYACLLCDTKNTLIVEFDNNGNILNRSCLLLEDEANILEFIYNYKESSIVYQKETRIILNNSLRQDDIIKRVIKLEIKTLLDIQNNVKLRYLFNEWFGYEENNLEEMQKLMFDELEKNISLKTKSIYDLIVLSYTKG